MGPSAEEVVDAAAKKGCTMPQLMVSAAVAAFIVMAILARIRDKGAQGRGSRVGMRA